MSDADISDEAVEQATGRDWSAWFEVLDGWEATQLDHQEIASRLGELESVSPWWAQMITVQYERERGMRAVGQTADGSFQVGVQRTISVDLETAWEVLTSREALDTWLAPLEPFELEEGATYGCQDGTTGQIRVLKPESHVRLTWNPPQQPSPTTLQVRITQTSSGKTAIRFHHEGLPDERAREHMRERWSATLERLLPLLDMA